MDVTHVSPTEIRKIMTFQNCLNVHVLVISKKNILFYHHGLNVAVGPTFVKLSALRQLCAREPRLDFLECHNSRYFNG